jgi:hypothetical protein
MKDDLGGGATVPEAKTIVETPGPLDGGPQEKLEYIKGMIEVAQEDKKLNMLYITLSAGVIALVISQFDGQSALPRWARVLTFLSILLESAGAAVLFAYIRQLHIVQMRMTRCIPSLDTRRVRELWAGDFGIWEKHKMKYRLGLTSIAIGIVLLAAVLFRAMVFSGSPAESLKIVPMAIPFGETRKTLTLDYIHTRYDKAASTITIEPKMVVLHWSDKPTIQSLYNTFAADQLSDQRPDILKAGRLNVSAHFGVDLDGTVYQFMPEDIMARHVIGLNRIAIGIENVGGPSLPLTDAQASANAELVRYLTTRFPSIEYLIGHHEYGKFRKTPLWEDIDPTYFTQKVDPGEDFMRLVRSKLDDLELKSSPDMFIQPRNSGEKDRR